MPIVTGKEMLESFGNLATSLGELNRVMTDIAKNPATVKEGKALPMEISLTDLEDTNCSGSESIKTKDQIESKLAKLEREMIKQVEYGIQNGWPVPFWDRNCVERDTLRYVLGKKRKPFCQADTLAGL